MKYQIAEMLYKSFRFDRIFISTWKHISFAAFYTFPWWKSVMPSPRVPNNLNTNPWKGYPKEDNSIYWSNVYKVNWKGKNANSILFLISNPSMLTFSPHFTLSSGLEIVLTNSSVSRIIFTTIAHTTNPRARAQHPNPTRYSQTEPTNNVHNSWNEKVITNLAHHSAENLIHSNKINAHKIK